MPLLSVNKITITDFLCVRNPIMLLIFIKILKLYILQNLKKLMYTKQKSLFYFVYIMYDKKTSYGFGWFVWTFLFQKIELRTSNVLNLVNLQTMHRKRYKIK